MVNRFRGPGSSGFLRQANDYPERDGRLGPLQGESLPPTWNLNVNTAIPAIVRIPWRYENDHALSGTSQENPIGIDQIAPIVAIVNLGPAIAAKIMVGPSGFREPKVTVPIHAGPVKFQSYDLEFGGGVFEVKARSGILLSIQEPVHRADAYADAYRVRFLPHGFGRCHQSESFRSSGMTPNPILRRLQITGNGDGIPIGKG